MTGWPRALFVSEGDLTFLKKMLEERGQRL